jgi:hypothetical protein
MEITDHPLFDGVDWTKLISRMCFVLRLRSSRVPPQILTQVPHQQTYTSRNSPTLRPSLLKHQLSLNGPKRNAKTRPLSHKDLRSLHFFSRHRLHLRVCRYCVLVQGPNFVLLFQKLRVLHPVSSDFHGVQLSTRFPKILFIPQ